MRSACTWMPEKGTQTPSPSPDLYPAKHLTGNSHFDWYNKRGHFNNIFTPRKSENWTHHRPGTNYGRICGPGSNFASLAYVVCGPNCDEGENK